MVKHKFYHNLHALQLKMSSLTLDIDQMSSREALKTSILTSNSQEILICMEFHLLLSFFLCGCCSG